MNSHTTNTNAVSPVLAVILMIGVTVILSTAIGILVLDLGQATTTQEPSNLGVTITEHEPGTVSINTKTGSTDSLRVLVNGEERVNQSVTPGDSTEITGVPENARISIIDASGSSEQVVLSEVVSNGVKVSENGVKVSEPSTSAPSDVSTVSFASGDGTSENPYVIMNDQQLQAMSADLGAHYVLGQNIDASGTREWNSADGFTPIGDVDNRFTGSLDGNGYVIDGLYINRSSTEEVGLIGYTDGGEISDTGVVNADVTGFRDVGGLVGQNRGTVTSSYSTGSVTGTDNNAGGLVGTNDGTVTSSYSTGSVTGTANNAGGLVGTNGGTVTSSYSTGSVSSTGNIIGGLVGLNSGTVEYSYSTGSVTGNEYVGGLVGYNFGDVTSSYSTGSVDGTDRVGGLVGLNSGTGTSSYWDTESSGQDSSSGSSISSGLTTSDMQGDSYDTDFETDIVDTPEFTGVTGEYPELAWESE